MWWRKVITNMEWKKYKSLKCLPAFITWWGKFKKNPLYKKDYPLTQNIRGKLLESSYFF